MTDNPLTPGAGKLEVIGSRPTVQSFFEWWVRRPVYLAVFILATLGSLIFGFIPGWGGVASAVCTIIATVTGFKAGVKYQKEIIR